jgi:hypothetical protein
MLDILILSNGPGEVTTWVRPVVAALRQRFNSEAARISVILSPCPNAGGREAEIALAYPGVDRAQAAEHFWSFLLQGRTADRWDWSKQGIVIFLGGDQIFPVLIGRRMGYRTLVYAEWEARWLPWIDRFALNQNHRSRRPNPRSLSSAARIRHRHPQDRTPARF